MNVNDVKLPEHIFDLLGQSVSILQRQGELESKYWEIEGRYSPVIDINDRRGQVIIKDFLWRITEELGEAIEAATKGEVNEKVWEELADGLHFVAGLCVITSKQQIFHQAWEDMGFPGNRPNAYGQLSPLIEALGCLGNTLKMKPWKQTDVLTDKTVFDIRLRDVIIYYLGYCQYWNLNQMRLWEYYYKKSEVNLFRIRSKY